MRAAEGLAGARYGMGSLRFLHADPRRAIADEHIVCLVCGRAGNLPRSAVDDLR